jgi:hypothetical protein
LAIFWASRKLEALRTSSSVESDQGFFPVAGYFTAAKGTTLVLENRAWGDRFVCDAPRTFCVRTANYELEVKIVHTVKHKEWIDSSLPHPEFETQVDQPSRVNLSPDSAGANFRATSEGVAISLLDDLK